MSFARPCLSLLLSGALALGAATQAAAQTPSRLSDLVGARAGQAEGELTSRGYQATGRSEVVGDGRLTYWKRGDDCVAIMTRDGRYASINQAGRSECGGGGSDGNAAAAAVAGVALVGLVAALAAHNNRHNDADRNHDSEYQRGYQAGLYGSIYDDRHETEGYHEGYLAGEAEATNRRNSNSRWVRQAPREAQDACARRADDFQSRPYGSSVPIGVRDLGGGQYEMTMATGSYRSVCRVTASGNVLSIDPY
ncbi:hypothetical protein [Brevundimonas sp. Root1279]|uniref:hypothetical protein n=1 Tax=Brevundimonas sp. Root1279 TaxID=1736443 RepID=UPI0006F6C825|nr:hypothetical protein [Brevundimonas sp. Root1279]KQW83641.1 hypothetical protein ASC65_03010 [Brevundimonas sp. Root1279]